MKCNACLTVIDEFFEGDLDERASGEVAAHIAACAQCTNALEDLQREQEIYSRYLREVEATPAVWPGISAGITREKLARASGFLASWRGWLPGRFVRHRWNPVLTAVSIVMVLGIALVLAQYISRGVIGPTQNIARQNTEGSERPPMNDIGTTANQASNPGETQPGKQQPLSGDKQQRQQQSAYMKRPSRRYLDRSVRLDRDTVAQSATQVRAQDAASKQIVIEAEKQYLNAIAVLSREFENRRTKLSPQRVATLNQALSAIDRTIADTSRAAREQSNNSLTVHYMLSAYTNKIELLREAVF